MHFQSLGIAMLLIGLQASAQMSSDRRTIDRAVYFSGDVTLEDGSKPPDPVLIQRVCKGSAQDATWTDSKGRFTFKVAGEGDGASGTDSAQSATPDADSSRPIGNSTYYSSPVVASLRDCEVQAVLAGYWSEHVSIALKNTLESTRVGTIVLHPVSKAQSLTVSATTLAAPPSAKKDYERGLEAMRKQRWDAASTEFTKAVAAYPKFAVAWFNLGLLRQNRNELDGAAEAWKEAIKSDPMYVKSYEAMTMLGERRQNWTDVEKYSREWIQLDAEDFPGAYLYNAVSNARLGKIDQAEVAARQGVRVDKEHKFSRLNYVLGLILMQKHEYSESAKCLRTYLELAPNAKDAATIREELSRMETAASTPQR